MKHLRLLQSLLMCLIALGFAAQADDVVYVAQIGETSYETLQAAVDAVPTTGEAATITMLADNVALDGFATKEGQVITFAMNGKTVYLSTPATIAAGSTVTLSGSRLLGIQGNDDSKDLINNYGILNFNGSMVCGKVTGKDGSTTNLKSGTIYLTLVGESGATVNIAGTTSTPRFLATNTGSVTAKSGSTFNITGGDMRVDLNVEDGANVTISGGYFKTLLKPEWIADGFALTYRSSTTSPYGLVADGDLWAKLVRADGSEFFYSQYMVGTALNSYSIDGDRLVLLKDHSAKTLSVSNTGKAITVDMNGFGYKNVDFSYGDVTLVNGTIAQDIDLYAQVENSGKVSNLTIGEGCVVSDGIVLWPQHDDGTVGYDANLTVKGTVNGGIFIHGNINEGNSVVNVENGGKVISEGYGINMNGYAIVNIKEGATVSGDITAIEVRAGELNITGGTITGGNGETSVSPNSSGSTTSNAGIAISQHTTKLPITLNVSGGEITATTAFYIVNPQNNDDTAGAINIYISGDEAYPNFVGHTTIEDDRAHLEISGGYFDDPVRVIDCAKGYIPVGPLPNDKYTVAIPVAQITREGEVIKYATLEAAFADALDAETIVVLRDCAGNGIKVPQGKFTEGLTVDFAGFTYTMDGSLVGSTNTQSQAFQLLKDNNITFKNGTIYSEKAYMLVQNYSNLTLDNMTLTLNKADYSPAYTLSNNNGNVTINNSTINANPAGGFAFDVCRYSNYASVSVTVTGESVINGNIEVYASASDAKDGFLLMLDSGTLNGAIVLDGTAKTAMAAAPDKGIVREQDTFNATPPAGYCWKSEGEGTGTSILVPAVARIEATQAHYASLADAVAAAQDGDTVTMIDNSTEQDLATVNTAITIDLNGKTVTREGVVLRVEADLTITDGTVAGANGIQARRSKHAAPSEERDSIEGTGDGGRGAQIFEGATLTIDNATVHGDQLGVFVYNGHLVMENDAVLMSNYITVYCDGTDDNTVTVNNGTITGAVVGTCMNTGSLTLNAGTITTTGNGEAVYFDSGKTFTMNGGTVTGPGEGLRIQNGTVADLNAGTITGTKYGAVIGTSSGTLNLNGATINSNGIGLSNNGTTTSENATTMNITDGAINGSVGIYHPGMGNLTISGGTITGGTGVVMRNGKLDISGGTIHATGDAKAYDYHNSGSSDTGDALQIESSNYGEHIGETFNGETYAGTEVTITYGVFISDNGKAVASYIKSDDPTQTDDGTARRLNFIYDGWYSNVIPETPDNYCAPGVEADPNERADTPDERAPYTIKKKSTGIDVVNVEGKTVECYYSIDGVRHSEPVQGVNIVKFTDNTTMKMIIK